MAEDRKTFKIKDGHLGEVKIADEVVAIIADWLQQKSKVSVPWLVTLPMNLSASLEMKNLPRVFRVEVLSGIVNVMWR